MLAASPWACETKKVYLAYTRKLATRGVWAPSRLGRAGRGLEHRRDVGVRGGAATGGAAVGCQLFGSGVLQRRAGYWLHEPVVRSVNKIALELDYRPDDFIVSYAGNMGAGHDFNFFYMTDFFAQHKFFRDIFDI